MKKVLLTASLVALTALGAVDASAQYNGPRDGAREAIGQGGQGRGGAGGGGTGGGGARPGQATPKVTPPPQPQPQPRFVAPPQPQPRVVVVAPQPRGHREHHGERWGGGHGGPPRGAWHHSRPHSWCVEKARRLHDFERLAASDGRVSRDERRIAYQLRADLDASCGSGRWHPERGWHY